MNSSQRTLLLLVVLFTTPILVAALFATKVLDPRQFGMTNHGALVSPPLEAREASWVDALYPNGLAPSHWSVLTIFRPGPCDEACAAVTSNLVSLPLILGQDGPRVSAAALTLAGGCADRDFPRCVELDQDTFAALEATLARRSQTRGTQMSADADLTVFMDWRKNLMLAFAHPFDRDDLKSDLKRLLKASRI